MSLVAKLPLELLDGRIAVCGCGKHQEPSTEAHPDLFTYRGPGSEWAANCVCGRTEEAHTSGRWTLCPEYVPRGPVATDVVYCGCRGWD